MRKGNRICLKFGSKCNLNCLHCHCMQSDFKYNPDIIKYMNDNHVRHLFLSGGEPWFYFDLIKEIIPQLKYLRTIKTTCNGTVMNDEIVDFCNKHEIIVAVSYDGEKGQRDPIAKPKYDDIAKIKINGVSSVYYHGNTDIQQIQDDIKILGDKYGLLFGQNVTNYPAFVHQTSYAPNIETTKEDAANYVKQIGRLLEYGFMSYDPNGSIFSLQAVHSFIRHFLNHSPYTIGTKCCNPHNLSMAIDGTFLYCPYGNQKIGDIYNGVDWQFVDSLLPERCHYCSLYPICGGACGAAVTDNECYIFRCLYRHYKKLLDKYHIDEKELLNRPEWDEE